MNSDKLNNELLNDSLENETVDNSKQCEKDVIDDVKVTDKSKNSKSKAFYFILFFLIILNFVCLIFSVIYSLELSEEIKVSRDKQSIVEQQIKEIEIKSSKTKNFALREDIEKINKNIVSIKEKSDNLSINSNQIQKHLESLDYKQNILEGKLSKDNGLGIWQVYEARYLISLANRKVLIDQDYVTAISLLKDADAILVALDDAKTFKLRGSIAHDINFLKNLSKVDKEGTLLEINELISNIKTIPLKKGNIISIFEQDANSYDINNWKDNLLSNGKEFLNKFITIRKRTSETDTELLSVEADAFLRANIQSQLILACKSFYQDDFKLYRENLKTAKNWIEKYFEKEDLVTSNTINSIDELVARTGKTEKVKEYLSSYITVVDYVNELKNKE